MSSILKLPAPVASFFSLFPLHTYPAIPVPSKKPIKTPTLWIAPPLPAPASSPDTPPSPLSADVECLKWQAYLALRSVNHIKVRWDISAEGGIDARLPNLHVPMDQSLELPELRKTEGAEDGELLAKAMIPTWVDARLGVDSAEDPLEGYKDELARDESRAWVSVLEGDVHAALIIHEPTPSYINHLLYGPPSSSTVDPLQTILSPPPAPLTGFTSLLPPKGTRISRSAILTKYRDAISALAERLGTDKWLLGSSEPTPLDALAFAYLHCILQADDIIRTEVTRRVNLVAWEYRVRCIVRDAFILP
ncbi:hypothetical protein BDQ12DRAFT_719226 [Crucibulum laeve]|uniref:Metaxin glutathione S-transferase domain-containing protein n=1 Tax=Crucibulum laeve TaxID=68775 RepID=A0A5C3MD68_9AGAR|nr:hypothetical protein BDQ12DRAFT_719226 [Crucibulum laeve]